MTIKKMSMSFLREKIIFSADLRNHYSEIWNQRRESGEAVVIAVNGRGI